MVNVVLTLAPAVSVAVTSTESVPISKFVGVPENCFVAALKLSQPGKELPLACVAVSVRLILGK